MAMMCRLINIYILLDNIHYGEPIQMQKKIIILGAGIGGLTVAHELLRCGKNYDIHIYERNNMIGGMARSGFKDRNGTLLPTEYCWRIYGPNYDNLRAILKQIPLQNNASKTVHDNLIDITDYLIADQQSIFNMNNRPKTLLDMRRAFKNIPLKQKWHVLNKIFYCFLISTKRLNNMDNMTWNDYIDPDQSLCHDMRKYIIDIMAPYLGADHRKVNVPSVAKTLESFKAFNRPISVMNSPTSIAWFDHWKIYLENNGVHFHFDSNITDIQVDGDKVNKVILSNDNEIIGDIYYCCLSVESVARMPSLKISGITELAERGYQLMVGIQLYFDKKIVLPHKNTAIYIPDSPWQLVIEPQGSIWSNTYDNIVDFWSIGLCDPVRSGLFIKKPFVACSHEEIQKEVWYQISSSELGKYLSLENINILDYNVWSTYVYNGRDLETHEPKFSTNKGTYFLRPQNETVFKNLYFATAYTRTQTDMFEMESAAESGRRAAQKLEKSVDVIPCDRPRFFAPYRWLDSIFPRLNLYRYFPLGWYCLGLPLSILLFLVNTKKNRDATS